MALETGTYISDLVATNPTATDPESQGDDHLRLIKATLLATFPNIDGAMNLTEEQLNLLDNKTLVAAQGEQKMPSGLIFKWGTATSNGSGVATFTYTNAFPTAALGVWFSQTGGNYTVAQSGLTTSAATAAVALATNGTAGAGIAVRFLVIGY